MFARPRVLSLFTTRRCTAACDHCAIGSSPTASGALSPERMRSLIDEAARAGHFERVVFTGGECFLLGSKLDALIAHAHAHGLATRAITNGYWAVSERAAVARAGSLRAAGLDELMLSTGMFHQRFVPVTRVLHAARAIAEAGIATHISIEECDQSTFDDTLLRADLRDLIDAGTISISKDAWIEDPGGRGTLALSHHTTQAASSNGHGPCQQVLDVVSVTPDGTLAACCGFPMEQLPALNLGSVSDRALDEVLTTAPNELLHMWLRARGPRDIAAFVAQYIPGYELPPAASICEVCAALQRDRRAMAVVFEHGDEVVERVACEFATLHRRTDATSAECVSRLSTLHPNYEGHEHDG